MSKKTYSKNTNKEVKERDVINIPIPWNKVIKPRTKNQSDFLKLLEENKITFCLGPAGSGKTIMAIAYAIKAVADGRFQKCVVARPVVDAGTSIGFLPGPQPLDAKILTPKGWSTMGEMQIGQEVIGGDGKPTKVIGIYPKGLKQVVRINTTDDTSAECCLDHLWLTKTKEEKKRGKSGLVRTTQEIINTLTKNGELNHYLPRNQAVWFSNKDMKLPISPYVLGCLLGDGSLGDTIYLSNSDLELLGRCNDELAKIGVELHKDKGESILYYLASIEKLFNNKPACLVSILDTLSEEVIIYNSIGVASIALGLNKSTLADRCRREVTIGNLKFSFLECPISFTNNAKEAISKLGLLGCKAPDKFIPDLYMHSSIEDRIALLQGLMDSDGSIKDNGEASFCTCSAQLANDIIELVRSLGGRACLRERKLRQSSTLKNGKKIISNYPSFEFNISLPNDINPFYISKKAKYHKCNYIYDARISSIEHIGLKEVQCIRVENPESLYITDDYIVTHNTVDDKIEPYFIPIFDAFSEVLNYEQVQAIKNKKFPYVELIPLTYLRGRTFKESVIIIDEAQNMTAADLKLILTRMGIGSKIILTGDPRQIDLYPTSTSGLEYVASLLEGIDGVSTIYFDKKDIQRDPIIAEVIERFEFPGGKDARVSEEE